MKPHAMFALTAVALAADLAGRGALDDKMIVVDARPVGGERGNALPLLLDLARKPAFHHDDSVPSLEELMNPARGEMSPHPFYIEGPAVRSDVAAFLRSLGG